MSAEGKFYMIGGHWGDADNQISGYIVHVGRLDEDHPHDPDVFYYVDRPPVAGEKLDDFTITWVSEYSPEEASLEDVDL